jgi:hypothetical protein
VGGRYRSENVDIRRHKSLGGSQTEIRKRNSGTTLNPNHRKNYIVSDSDWFKLKYLIFVNKENASKGSAVMNPDGGHWDIWNHNFKFFQETVEIQTWGILEAGDCRIQDEKIQ